MYLRSALQHLAYKHSKKISQQNGIYMCFFHKLVDDLNDSALGKVLNKDVRSGSNTFGEKWVKPVHRVDSSGHRWPCRTIKIEKVVASFNWHNGEENEISIDDDIILKTIK